MTMREWAGRAIALTHRAQRPRFPMMLLMSQESAQKLALALGRLRQTYSMGLLPEVEEIYQALNYVLVADPHSVALHAQMEASKGMDPGDSDPPRHPRPLRETEINLAQPEPLTDPGLRARRLRNGEFYG